MITVGAEGSFHGDYGLLTEAALLDLDAEGLEVPALASALSGFTGRWSWGVRTLVQDGNQFAQRLGLTAGMHADTEGNMSGVAMAGVKCGLGARLLNEKLRHWNFFDECIPWESNSVLGEPHTC